MSKWAAVLLVAMAAGACGGDDEDDDCGNGLVDPGELCDDANDDDTDECTSACVFSCGDGVVAGDEECDTGIAAGEPGACPTAVADCDDGVACTEDVLVGSFCTARCENPVIMEFVDNDGCCPELGGATAFNDFDCPAECGNGLVELGETCDTGIGAGEVGACPTDCDDGEACTVDTLVVPEVSDGACQARCEHAALTEVANDDGCCAPGATSNTDNDCSSVAQCGNGIVNGGLGELCDPGIAPGEAGACPTECASEDPCIHALLVSASTCEARCVELDQQFPLAGDMCCPVLFGGNNRNDPECTSSCGTPQQECELGAPFCDADCRIVRSAFRVHAITIVDPHVYFENDTNGICADLTTVANNSVIPDALEEDGDGDGFADIGVTIVFKPLDLATGTNAVDIVFASCDPGDPTAQACFADPNHDRVATAATHVATGSCLDVEPGTLTDAYDDPVTPVDACFVTDAFDAPEFAFGNLIVPLSDAHFAAQLTGDPATGLVQGLIRGFVSEEAAATAIIPADVLLIGGKPLSGVLAGGIDPSCPTGSADGPPIGDDRDVGPDGVTMGWYFYVNFEGTLIPFEERPNAGQ